MAKAKKKSEPTKAKKIDTKKPKEESKPKVELKPKTEPKVEEKPIIEEKPVEIKAKIEIPEKELIMPCLYKCKCNLTKDGKAYKPGSIVKLTTQQVDQILKHNPEAIEPA